MTPEIQANQKVFLAWTRSAKQLGWKFSLQRMRCWHPLVLISGLCLCPSLFNISLSDKVLACSNFLPDQYMCLTMS